MKKNRKVGAILIGLVVGAISYWFQPYNQTEIAGISIWLIMGAGSFIGALVYSFLLESKAHKIALPLTIGVLIAILSRILYDTILWDPTSHNLAPFEFIFAIIACFPSALVGAFIGSFIPISFKS